MEPMLAEFWQASSNLTVGYLGLRFLVAVLATWRIASLLVNEDGPGLVFWRLRFRLGVGDKSMAVFRKPDASRPDGKVLVSREAPRTLLGGLLECLWCTSVWVAAATLILSLTPLWWLLWPFAISAGAIWLDAAVSR